jgi:hypothetical protein
MGGERRNACSTTGRYQPSETLSIFTVEMCLLVMLSCVVCSHVVYPLYLCPVLYSCLFVSHLSFILNPKDNGVDVESIRPPVVAKVEVAKDRYQYFQYYSKTAPDGTGTDIEKFVEEGLNVLTGAKAEKFI